MYRIYITDFRNESRKLISTYNDKREIKNRAKTDIKKHLNEIGLESWGAKWDLGIFKVEFEREQELCTREVLTLLAGSGIWSWEMEEKYIDVEPLTHIQTVVKEIHQEYKGKNICYTVNTKLVNENDFMCQVIDKQLEADETIKTIKLRIVLLDKDTVTVNYHDLNQ